MPRQRTYLSRLGAAACLILVAACSSPATESGGGPAGAGENTLVIASWGGRFTETTQQFLATPFKDETGIDVQIVDVPGTQVTQLQAQRKAGQMRWDVMDSLGAGDAFVLEREGLVKPLTEQQKAAYVEALGADKVSDFGFTYANLGYIIVCNDNAERCPATVPEFFDVQNFPGARALPGASPSQMTSILAEAAGVKLPQNVDTLLEPLQRIKPSVKVFYTSGDQQEQLIRQGEVAMIIMYSGRAYNVQDGGTPVTINWAGTYDPGYTAAVVDAPHPEAAQRFMDWVVQHPEAQAKWAEQMQYSVPSPKALQMLPAEIAERLADYPANYEKLGQQDFPWYVDNKAAIDQRLNQIIQGA
jgi:putative spermidine/putrescine transport system substrate-binding protein